MESKRKNQKHNTYTINHKNQNNPGKYIKKLDLYNNNVKQNDEIGMITLNTLNALNNMKVVSKKVEINTKVTYTYEDGSVRTVNSVETHEFK